MNYEDIIFGKNTTLVDFTRHAVCRCPAFDWPHASGLAWACINNDSDRFAIPRFLRRDTRDFRDTGNPLKKVYPQPDWRNWEKI